MRRFFKFLYDNGIIKYDLSKSIPQCKIINQPKLPSTYTKDEILTLLSSIDRRTNCGKRNYAIIIIIVRLGLRASDIKNLKFENIHWETNTIELEQFKTGKKIILPLLTDVGNALLDYIQYARTPSHNSPYIFLPSKQWVRNKCMTVGLINLHEHCPKKYLIDNTNYLIRE